MPETLTWGLIGKQDLNLGKGTFVPTLPDGTTPTFDKIGIHSLLGLSYFNAADYTTGDASQKINAAYVDLPAAGGIIDARALTGSQAWSTNPFAGTVKPVTLLLGESTIVTTAQLLYATTGHQPGLKIIGAGMRRTIFDNRLAGAAMIALDGSATPNTWGYGAILRDFSITTATGPATSHGIQIHAQWFPTIERVRIEGLSGDAIRIINNSTDPDASYFPHIIHCQLQSNGGWGITHVNPTVSASATGDIQIIGCYIVDNTAGGIRALGQAWTIDSCGIAGNGGNGLYLPYVNGTAFQQLNMVNCEFDGNTTYDINIEGITQGIIDNCKFVCNGTPANIVRIGDGGASGAANVHVRNPIVRRDSGTITVFTIGSNATGTMIDGYTANTSTGVTPYADSGVGTLIKERGHFISLPVTQVSGAAATSYTPDLATAIANRVAVTTTGTFTINAPIFTNGVIAFGQEIELIIVNGSGGTINCTFNAAYVPVGFINPANGLTTSAKFRRIDGAVAWVQVGAWSMARSILAASPATPYAVDVGVATFHHVTIGATGAFTLSNPTKTGGTLTNGDELELVIVNGSGGAITLTFGAAFLHGGYTDPATGTQKSAKFRYLNGSWYLVGAWSAAY